MELQLNLNEMQKMREDFLHDEKYRVTQNAVTANGIKKSITNKRAIESRPFSFSVDVDSDAVMNQNKSGRCWMFSALNFIRFHIEKELNIKNFELSTDFTFFYDKLEKANYFYHNILLNTDKPLSDRKMQWLIQTPQQDGGDWSLILSLIEKYGLVPKSVMDETVCSQDSQELNFMFNRKLQGDAMILRDMVKSGATDMDIEQKIKDMNSENYKIISICLGNPPEKFNFEYRDNNNEYHVDRGLTPLEFYKKYVKINLNDYVEVMNVPGYDMYQSYGIECSKNMVGGIKNHYVNIPMYEMEDLLIKQLKNGEPVWFGCDVLQEWNNPAGFLGLKVYDWKRSFGFDIVGDKTQRFDYHESLPTHAMLVSGVDLDENERPTNWKIENSWGSKLGHKGYFIMGNDWMDQYTYEAVINKKYLSEKQLDAYNNTKSVILPYWNAFNPI